MPRLDQARVHRTDGYLVHARPFDPHEGKCFGTLTHRRHGAGIVTHRMPVARPVLVQHDRAQEWVADWHDPEEDRAPRARSGSPETTLSPAMALVEEISTPEPGARLADQVARR